MAQTISCFSSAWHHERVAGEPVPLERKQRVGNSTSVQRCLGVEEVLAFILQCPRAPAYNEPDCLAIAKTLSRLHADGQFMSEHAQAGTDLVFQQASDLMVA